MTRQMCAGDGWRLGWNPHADSFVGLVAGDGWAMELTAAEFKDFCRLVRSLHNTMTTMTEQLMDEESITCEQETKHLWIEAEGFPHCYSLRFILLTQRGCEGAWPASVVPALTSALSQPPFINIL
ncbi:MAG: DUF1818 family protein [Cyanobacteria bacterium J06607_13]